MAREPLAAAVRAALAAPPAWPGTTDEVSPITLGLTRVPPLLGIDRDELDAVDGLVTTLGAPAAQVQAAAVAVLAAWHVEPGGVDERVGRYVALADRMLAELPTDLHPQVAIPATDGLVMPVVAFAGLLGAVGPDPMATAALLTGGARTRMTGGDALGATALAGAAAEIELRAGGLGQPTRDLLASCADTLAATVVTTPATVAVLHRLMESYELLGQPAVAQSARMALLQMLLELDLPQQALRLLPHATEPVVVPGQHHAVRWARARALTSLGRADEARAVAVELRDAVPAVHPAQQDIRVLLAGLDAQAGRWQLARDEIAPVVARVVADGVVPDPRATAAARVLLLDATWASHLGAARDVAVRREQVAALAAASAAVATVIAPLTTALAADTAGQPVAEMLWTDVRDRVDGALRSSPERVSGAGLAGVLAEVETRLTRLAAARGDAVAAMAHGERSRADLLRAAGAIERDPGADAGVAGFLDTARHRLAARTDTREGGGLRALAAAAVEELRDRPLQQLLGTAPAPAADTFGALARLLADAGPDWLAISVVWAHDRVVVTSTDGASVWTDVSAVPDPGLAHRIGTTFTRSGGGGPDPRRPDWRDRAQRCLDALEPVLAAPVLRAVARSGRSRVVLSLPGALACVPLPALPTLLDGLTALTVVGGFALAAETASRWTIGPAGPRTGVLVGGAVDAEIPGAALEAALVGMLHGDAAQVLSPVEQARLVAEVPRSAVLHLASHASWSVERVADGGMRLGADGLDAGELLVALDLRGIDLVVLSACDTASSTLAPGGEAMNLAALVGLAGAPRVVATLWPVTDAAAVLFSTALHRRLADGEPAAAATLATTRWLRSLTCGAAAATADGWITALRAGGSGREREALVRTAAELSHGWRTRPADEPALDLWSASPFACFGVP